MSLTLQRVSAMRIDAAPTPPAELVSIKAQFNQGGAVIVGTDSLDTLKQYLTVEATYSDSSTRVLSDNEYTLSGTLAYPSATVTVDYQGETDTFTVVVAYDAQVEYLQSTGTQYIDLGIHPSSTDIVTIDFQMITLDTVTFYGCRLGTNVKKFTIGKGSNGYFYAALGNHANVSLASQDSNRHIIVVDATTGNATIDSGSPIYVGNYYDNDINIFLFAFNNNGVVSAGGSLNIFSCQIGNRTDLIPVRCGTTGYMYDRVNGTLFGNNGMGAFIVGADV